MFANTSCLMKSNSWQIDKHLLVLFITLHVPSLDQNFDLLFDHWWLRFEHLDHAHDFCNELHVGYSFASLENLDRSSLDNDLTFGFDLVGKLIISLGWLYSLLLLRSCGDQIDSDVVVCELQVDPNLLIGVIECRFLDLLIKDTHFWIAEMD